MLAAPKAYEGACRLNTGDMRDAPGLQGQETGFGPAGGPWKAGGDYLEGGFC